MTDEATDGWSEICRPAADPKAGDDWRRRLERWRDDARAAVNYDGSRYQSPELAWTRSCFVSGMLMLWDEELYRGGRGEPRAFDFLRQGEARFGGFDAVVLWHAYPRLGFDDRNQFDFYRQLPGGVAGLRALVGECHALGTRALLAYCPWDGGTRREPTGDLAALVALTGTVGADGIFLDTLAQASSALLGLLKAGSPGAALMTEDTVPLAQIADHPMSWAQWPRETPSPYVLRSRWFEPRHMQFLVRRWHRDHSNELHLAWLNGAGMVVWENIFGTWNPWSSRDEALLRQMRPVQRLLGNVFSEGRWAPLVETCETGIYASRWEADGLVLWTVANMTPMAVRGPLLPVDAVAGQRHWDLVGGAPVVLDEVGGRTVLSGGIEAYGIAAFAGGASRLEERLAPLLRRRPPARVTVRPPVAVPAVIPVPPPSVPPPPPAPVPPPSGPMRQFEAGSRDLTVRYRLRECGLDGPAPLVDAVFPELHQVITETRHVTLGPYAIDVSPVTNAEFRDYLKDSGYQPRYPENFLRHWAWAARPSADQSWSPVVFVDMDDARAYALWAHKRLPTPYEWQHAMASGRTGYGPGRIWEWTESEISDGHTRSVLLKGGTDYRARGSDWYADGGTFPPEWCARFIRIGPALDRCATIGFRCCTDLPAGPFTPRHERPSPGAREVTT